MASGRPLKFKSVEELQEKIDDYFCSFNKDGLNYGSPVTITGLALALGTSRETLCNYEAREEFFDAIKEAKTKVEHFAELQLFKGSNAAGPIFALKNHGWKDKQETEHSGSMNISWPLPKTKLDG